MKKHRRQQAVEQPAAAAGPWWPWIAGLVAFLFALQVYGPAIDGDFVLDDRGAPFLNPNAASFSFWQWIGTNRPLLMFSYWINHEISGLKPGSYHILNVFFHTLTAIAFTLVIARILTWTGLSGRLRAGLAVFGGALFLFHPVQAESVAYVSSRSEILSVLFVLSAFALWLHAGERPVSAVRSIVIMVLFALAILTKEHTVMLPLLVILTDFFFQRGGLKRNRFLYGMFLVGAAFGAYVIIRVLRVATTVGFDLKNLSPATYFFTQCRVIWTYVRLFLVPVGLNADPDVAVSHSILDHGTLYGLAALLGVVVAAWIYRKRFPLASYGTFVFLLLLAPTSSFMPIDDVQAERRLYLPFLGLVLIVLEVARRFEYRRILGAGGAIIAILAVLTYQRSAVWAGPVPLWTDAATKSPKKVRPRFQLAYAYYEQGQCPMAVTHYEAAAQLAAPTYDLMADWALALDCGGRTTDAIPKAREAASLENSAHVHALLGMLHAKIGDFQRALQELAVAEKIDPRFEMTYVYRGNIAERGGDRAAAAREYRKALAVNPYNGPAQEGLTRLSRNGAGQ